MATPLRVLLVEDSADDAELALAELRRAGYAPEVRRVFTEAALLETLASTWDIILTDFHLPRFNGLRVLELCRAHAVQAPIILVTGALGEEAAVDCIRQGAADYLLKDRLSRLGPAVRRVLEEKTLRDQQRLSEAARLRYAERLRILHEIDQSILAAQSPQAVAEAALSRIRELIPARRASVLVFDLERRTAERLALMDDAPVPPGDPPQMESSQLAWLERGQPHLIGDVQRQPAAAPLSRQMAAQGIRAHLTVPLRVQQQLIGALTLASPSADVFTSEHVEIAQEVADQLAIVLQQSRLLAETRRRVEELAGLQQVAQAFGQLTDLPAMFRTLTFQVAQLVQSEQCVVARLDPDGMLRGQVPGHGLSDEALEEIVWPLDPPDDLAWHAYLARGYLLANTLDDLPSPLRRLASTHQAQNLLAVPMFSGHEFTGHLIVANKAGGFGSDDVRLLQVFSGQAAIIIEKARLFDETRRRAAELAALAEASSALRQAQTREALLPRVLYSAQQAVQAEGGLLLLLEAGSLRVAAAAGPAAGWTGSGLTPGDVDCLQPILDSGRPLHWETHAPLSGHTSLELEPGSLLRAALQDQAACAFLPLLTADAAVGLLGLVWTAQRTHPENDLRLLTAIAEMAGNALHRSGVMETLEQRVAERTQALAAANERLQELDKLKDQFVSNVSHELRTPLTNISLYAGLLEKRGAAELERAVPLLKREARRLSILIEDLLQLANLEQGKAIILFEPRVIDGLIAEVVQAHAARAEAKQLWLEHTFNLEAPPVAVDFNQMMQVFTNLVGNAVAYTPPGGRVSIRTIQEAREGRAGLTADFHNDGPPISAEDLPHIFERFYRGQTGRDSGEAGTGLGLSICREIIDRHHGQISVTSTTEAGTTFSVWLPLETPE